MRARHLHAFQTLEFLTTLRQKGRQAPKLGDRVVGGALLALGGSARQDHYSGERNPGTIAGEGVAQPLPCRTEPRGAADNGSNEEGSTTNQTFPMQREKPPPCPILAPPLRLLRPCVVHRASRPSPYKAALSICRRHMSQQASEALHAGPPSHQPKVPACALPPSRKLGIWRAAEGSSASCPQAKKLIPRLAQMTVEVGLRAFQTAGHRRRLESKHHRFACNKDRKRAHKQRELERQHGDTRIHQRIAADSKDPGPAQSGLGHVDEEGVAATTITKTTKRNAGAAQVKVSTPIVHTRRFPLACGGLTSCPLKAREPDGKAGFFSKPVSNRPAAISCTRSLKEARFCRFSIDASMCPIPPHLRLWPLLPGSPCFL